MRRFLIRIKHIYLRLLSVIMKFINIALIISLLLLSGCKGIFGDSISSLFMTGLYCGAILYVISLLFIGIGLLIRKPLSSTIKFRQNPPAIAILIGIATFILLNIPLLFNDPDIAGILFYLVVLCSFAISLAVCTGRFGKSALWLLLVLLVLIVVFVIDMHWLNAITTIYRMFLHI